MTVRLFVATLALGLAACGASGSSGTKAPEAESQALPLSAFAFDAAELHQSLEALPLDELPLHVPRAVLFDNPQVSTERNFVYSVSRGSSQGRLEPEGIRSALYGVYGDEDGGMIGFYGLEAASLEVADEREDLLHQIWPVNVSAERARIHREGVLLFVVWNAPDTPACWEAVNAVLVERLGSRD